MLWFQSVFVYNSRYQLKSELCSFDDTKFFENVKSISKSYASLKTLKNTSLQQN